MKKLVCIILLSLAICSCGKKGSLEYPSLESYNSYKLERNLA